METADLTILSADLHSIAVAHRSNWTFLEVRTADGLVGWGEATLRAHEGVLGNVLDSLRPSVLGNGAAHVAALMKALPGLPSGRAGNCVLSALNQAISDIEAQRAGQPLYAHLNGSRRELPAYATVNRSIAERTAQGFAEAARRAVECGFGGVKVMPFETVMPATASEPGGRLELDLAIERIAAVREAIGDRADLMVDCHWRLDEPTSLILIRELAPFRLKWLECPVPESPEWWLVIARLRKEANSYGLLLAGAENIIGVAGVLPFLEGGLYDVVMPDIKYCGGHEDFRRIVDRARAFGVSVSPHNPSGPIAHAHTLHVCAALGLDEAVEQQFAESTLFEECLTAPLAALKGGCFTPPNEPGLGTAVRRSVVAEHPIRLVPLSLADPSFA